MAASTEAPETTSSSRGGARVAVQKFGTFLSNMIMPNIGAIIAWGLITAFFIPVGWTPNEKISTMVDPTIFFLLPILIAYTGGKIVYDVRGGVVGAMATMGVIMATSFLPVTADLFLSGDQKPAPMFLGAMVMGPLAAWIMKRVDSIWVGKIPPGFEMLVNNFSAGIMGAVLAIASMFLLAPVILALTAGLGDIVDTLVENDLLPLTSIFIEPAKVLFLNNAINHGVLTPLGLQEARESGKSVLFLLEANPGPGLGILLAYMVFGRGVARASAPGAAIIHFFGGIHEIYFPYVLMKPKLILAAIAGGMTGVFINVLFDVGLRAPAAPGSIIAIYTQTASDSYLGVTLAVFGAAAVSFLVASLLLKTDRSEEEGDLAAATASMEGMKGKKSIASSTLGAEKVDGPIRDIVFACDAGMGSSAMGASVLRNKIKDAGFPDVVVVNQAIANLQDTHDLIVTHQDLTDRARQRAGSAIHVSVDNFMNSPRYDEIVELVRESNSAPVVATTGGGSAAPVAAAPAAASGGAHAAEAPAEAPAEPEASVLAEESIVLGGSATDASSAITEAGQLLVAAGAVPTSYVDAMHLREQSVSTHMGNGLAIPHGTNEAKSSIERTAISFVRYDQPIDWNGKPAEFVIGIAGAGNDHLAILGKLAKLFVDNDQVARLRAAQSPAEVMEILDSVRA